MIFTNDPWYISGYDLLEEIWITVNCLKPVLCNCSIKILLFLWTELQNNFFFAVCFISKYCCQNLCWFSECLLILVLSIADFDYCNLYTCNILGYSALWKPFPMRSLSMDSQQSVKQPVPYFHLHSVNHPQSFIKHFNSLCRWMSKFEAKIDTICWAIHSVI